MTDQQTQWQQCHEEANRLRRELKALNTSRATLTDPEEIEAKKKELAEAAKKAEKEGFTVYMVTPDKDYGQLISPNILQYKPGKSGSESEIIDSAKVCEKYGIGTPEQVFSQVELLHGMGLAAPDTVELCYQLWLFGRFQILQVLQIG